MIHSIKSNLAKEKIILEKMLLSDLTDILRIEECEHKFPWTKKKLEDSLKSEYDSWIIKEKKNLYLVI
tara:strand:- start:57 stop:260 length:204 start_codon:yes stop_codon:yes gene_type:complete